MLRRGFVALGLAVAAWGPRAAPSGDGDDEALLADADYTAARAALQAGDAAAAVPRLQQALKRFPDSADVHNELGFAHRKLRQFDKAFEHYRRALQIEPRHRGAHEYIGEAYLMVGDLPAAERHLAALRSICLLSCEEQRDLEKAIAEYRVRGTQR
ncbi:tetratricopeptide repeat protein [Caenimonas aquaedulcis]|nr:tetratricopeptide repeat protein [Caenimonas aquaedulcis]